MEPIITVSLISAASGIAGAIIAGLWQRRKTGAETDSQAADANEKVRATVMLLLNPLKTEIQRLGREVDQLKEENSDLRDWAERLVCQVKDLGGHPTAFEPKTEKR